MSAVYSISWSPGVTLEGVERQAVEMAYRFYNQNKTQTARALDIAIRTLEAKLEKYAIDDNQTEKAILDRRFNEENFRRRQRGLAPIAGGPEGALHLSGREGKREVGKAEPGVRLEPASRAAEESGVPLPVRREVQKVLPPQTSAHRSGKDR